MEEAQWICWRDQGCCLGALWTSLVWGGGSEGKQATYSGRTQIYTPLPSQVAQCSVRLPSVPIEEDMSVGRVAQQQDFGFDVYFAAKGVPQAQEAQGDLLVLQFGIPSLICKEIYQPHGSYGNSFHSFFDFHVKSNRFPATLYCQPSKDVVSCAHRTLLGRPCIYKICISGQAIAWVGVWLLFFSTSSTRVCIWFWWYNFYLKSLLD